MFIKRHPFEEINFRHFRNDLNLLKPNQSVLYLSLRREGARLTSNAACVQGQDAPYICHGCGNNEARN